MQIAKDMQCTVATEIWQIVSFGTPYSRCGFLEKHVKSKKSISYLHMNWKISPVGSLSPNSLKDTAPYILSHGYIKVCT